MSEQSGSSSTERERTELPIERGFPIERINEIAEKEGRAKMYYRPIYTMHKWWARRLGCVFRAISLYTLLDDPEKVEVFEPGQDNETLADWGDEAQTDIASLIDRVDMSDPESLWELYPKDVRVEDKKILDPFMGGGTSLIEASRFGAECHGNDLNPVAWYITSKEIDAGTTNVGDLNEAFDRVKDKISDDIQGYYKTECPNGDHKADVMYFFWVRQLDCVSCQNTVSLFKDYRLGKSRYGQDGYQVLCPDCHSIVHTQDWRSQTSCDDCAASFVPQEGNYNRGNYSCPDCGQKYRVTDAIQEQEGYNQQLCAIEYYCGICDEEGLDRCDYKNYKSVDEFDLKLVQEANQEWKDSDELKEYIPQESIPEGAITATVDGSQSSSVTGNNVFQHNFNDWSDMFNNRQLLSLAKIMKAIDEIEDQNSSEFLLLALTESLNYNNMMSGYQASYNKATNLFKSNSFEPPVLPVEINVWGSEYGAGSFSAMWDMVLSGVEYSNAPTERYIENGETHETEPFSQPLGDNCKVTCGDMREMSTDTDYDAIITDPPYYDNVIYSELSDFFYVWQRVLLKDEYNEFEPEMTPRKESIVANPALNKGAEEFETELGQAFSVLRDSLKEDGVLTFTYHHSDSDSWGELLTSVCNSGFIVTATYPITADIQKFIKGEAVSFDIVVVARPINETEPVSWNSLRRDIYRTARKTRQKLENTRDLSRGDIGVMEMGACFREYSKHHGKVQRDGDIMSAKEVVQEIYGIIQEASDIGVEDVFIDLLDSKNPTFDDVNKLCRGTNATPQELKEMCLYNQDDGFELGTWDNEKRQAYIQERTNGDSDDHLSNLDKLQFLRYRYEKGQAVQNYVDKWGVDDDLRELAGRLADVTGDETYTRVLGDRDITSY